MKAHGFLQFEGIIKILSERLIFPAMLTCLSFSFSASPNNTFYQHSPYQTNDNSFPSFLLFIFRESQIHSFIRIITSPLDNSSVVFSFRFLFFFHSLTNTVVFSITPNQNQSSSRGQCKNQISIMPTDPKHKHAGLPKSSVNFQNSTFPWQLNIISFLLTSLLAATQPFVRRHHHASCMHSLLGLGGCC